MEGISDDVSSGAPASVPPYDSRVPTTGPTFREALRVWLHVGVNSFGGPAGQIAVLHREIVERRKWITEARFLHALDLCMLLPGPEAQQLAVYSGWLLHGVRGGLAAGLLFVAPGAVVMLGLSFLYVEAAELDWFQALFFGIKAGVVALVVIAACRIAARALTTPLSRALAAAAFLATWFFGVPFPIVISSALALGFLVERVAPGALRAHATTDPVLFEGPAPSIRRSARTALLGLTIWLAPVALVVALDPGGGIQAEAARFFTGASVLTFGGAYAALSYTAEHAVELHGWLTPGEMADGLGFAESTPGPLILVLQFVAFVGAHHEPGRFAPSIAGMFATAVMLWTTFAPCFLWIFLFAPWMERARASRMLTGALAAATAVVVGVVVDLVVWFATHVLFREARVVDVVGFRLELPRPTSVDWAAVAIAALAYWLLARRRWPLLAVLATCAALGFAARTWG